MEKTNPLAKPMKLTPEQHKGQKVEPNQYKGFWCHVKIAGGDWVDVLVCPDNDPGDTSINDVFQEIKSSTRYLRSELCLKVSKRKATDRLTLPFGEAKETAAKIAQILKDY